jgi:hypothetical protein
MGNKMKITMGTLLMRAAASLTQCHSLTQWQSQKSEIPAGLT